MSSACTECTKVVQFVQQFLRVVLRNKAAALNKPVRSFIVDSLCCVFTRVRRVTVLLRILSRTIPIRCGVWFLETKKQVLICHSAYDELIFTP